VEIRLDRHTLKMNGICVKGEKEDITQGRESKKCRSAQYLRVDHKCIITQTLFPEHMATAHLYQ
jgi:hypothetical protein